MTTDERRKWELSLHEAGHAIVAESEGVAVEGACLLRDNAGICWHGHCGAFSGALIAAAGLSADALSPGIEMPEAPATPSPLATAVDVVGTSSTGDEPPSWMTDTPPAPVVSDARCLALWCITGLETEPERWAERRCWVLGLAEKILHDHQARWVALAARLYRAGFLLPEHARVLHDDEGKR